MTLTRRWIGAARSQLLLAGILLVLVAGGLAALVVFRPWSGGDAGAQITAENLRSEKANGLVQRPVSAQATPSTPMDQNGQQATLSTPTDQNGQQVSGVEKSDRWPPVIDASLKTLEAKASVFPWENSDLLPGVTYQSMYQFPTNALAAAYYWGLLQQAGRAGWARAEEIDRSANGDTKQRWVVLKQDGLWAAVGGKENNNLVFSMQGKDEQAIDGAIAGVEGISSCCLP